MAAVLASGCVSGKLTQARSEFRMGHLEAAAMLLDSADAVSSRDRLLYFMEKGVILHDAGRYGDSIQAFRAAADLIRDQEVISAGRQAASLVTTEWMTEYKGEYAERLLVHTYLMMDYLLVGDPESALVEAKQALGVYEDHPVLKDDVFTRALIAHCFEAMGEDNGAYIEYKKLAELLPEPGLVADKLCEIGKRLGFDDEVAAYGKYLSESVQKRAQQPPGPELIVFLSQGRAPVKKPTNIFIPPAIRFSFPAYAEAGGEPWAPLPMEGPLSPAGVITTDVGKTLKASLGERLTQVIAKETARVAVKEVMANQVEDDLAQALVRITFLLLEEADTRGWETLPAYLTLARTPLQPGNNPISLHLGGAPDILVGPRTPRFVYRALKDGRLIGPVQAQPEVH